MWFCIYSRRFTRFGVGLGNTVNCDTLAPQRKHEKTLDFYTDYPLFRIIDVFLICFFTYFSTVKRVIFNHTKKQVNYHTKVGTWLASNQRLCNRIAFCMANLHFSSRFTVICWRKKTTVKLDRKKQRQVGVGGCGFLALSLSKKHSPTPCDRRAGWVVVVGLGWVGLGWVGLGWLVGWLVGWLAGWLVGWLK